MRTSAISRYFPTFATWSRRPLLPIRAMCRVGGRLFPRVAMVLALVMGCELVWIGLMAALTGRVRVAATIREQTLVLFNSEPPQPRGNCFSVSPTVLWGGLWVGPRPRLWKVCNMHAENFSAIVQRLQLWKVEVQPLDEGRCLITDPRIPRDWLLDWPCPTCFRDPEAEDLLMRYPERFRPPAGP
jgi:hypothetical protein